MLIQTTNRRGGSGQTLGAEICSRLRVSSDNPAHDLSSLVGQPEVASLVPEREPLVIDAAQVQHRGMEVMHVHLLAGRPMTWPPG